MAINRDIAYYIDFKNKRGWDMRFEIIPAGEPKAANTYTWTRLTGKVISIEDAQFDFDDLPIGIMKAPTLSIKFDFKTAADANLQELLLQPHYTTGGGINTSNVYNLLTNYGDGTQPMHFLFCGGQSLELGNEISLNSNHELVGITVKSIDIVKLILETTRTADFCAYCVANLTATDINALTTGVFSFDSGTDLLSNKLSHVGEGTNFNHYSLAQVFGQTGLGAFLKTRLDVWLRRTGLSPSFALTLENNITRCITFRRQTRTFANTAGTDLAASDILFAGKLTVTRNGSSVDVGLFYADAGDETFQSAEYLHEFIKEIAEGFCVKFKWRASGTGSHIVGGTHYVNVVTVGWYKPFESALHGGAAQDITNFNIIANDGTYTAVTASNVFRSAEVELPNIDGDNIATIENDLSGIANTSTWNVKLPLYGVPVLPTQSNNANGIYASRLYLRTLFYKDGTKYYTVHGSVRIDDGVHGVTNYDNPVLWTDTNPIHVDAREAVVKGWVLETQRTNTAAVAIAEWITATFSSPDITKRTLQLQIDGDKLGAWSIGDVFILDAITGSNAGTSNVLMSMKADWIRGTATCEFVSIQ